MRLRIILAFRIALIYYTQDFRVYEGTRDQPIPGPFPAPPIFLREKPRGRGCRTCHRAVPPPPLLRHLVVIVLFACVCYLVVLPFHAYLRRNSDINNYFDITMKRTSLLALTKDDIVSFFDIQG